MTVIKDFRGFLGAIIAAGDGPFYADAVDTIAAWDAKLKPKQAANDDKREDIIDGDMVYIDLGGSEFARVDLADYELVKPYLWSVKGAYGKGYYVRTFDQSKRFILMHRLIMDAQKGQIVDHINGDNLDNRRANLRFVTAQQNSMNRLINVNSTTGVKGVSRLKRNGKYISRIKVGGISTYLGEFETIQEAAFAYEKAAMEKHGEYANFG